MGSLPILVVEDNLLMRRIREAHLVELGYRVATAENGQQALDLSTRWGTCRQHLKKSTFLIKDM